MNTAFPNQIVYPIGNANFPDGFKFSASMASRQTHGEFSGFYRGFDKHLLRVGTGYQYIDYYKLEPLAIFGETVTDLSDSAASYGRELIRNNWHIFIQDTWSFLPNWELTAGVRYDEYSDFGNTTNPRLALVWQTRPNLTTKLLYGQAFRAPTFNQINDSESNPFALGNPNLKPETIETWELAFDYRAAGNLHFGLNLFTYFIEDKVIFVSEFGNDEIRRAQNVGEQEGQGFELETRWQVTKKIKLLFNYAFQDSTDKTNNHTVGNAPQHQVYLRSDWLLIPDWFLNGQVNWIGKRERPFGDPRDNLEGYTTVDLTLRHKNPQKPWSIAVSVRNLFDEDVREPSYGPDSSGIINMPYDIPMAGRSFFGEVRYQF
ncbi:conserved hypothetical protein [Beggiatoa sp. PS]|nr:conserved hypothetical protein [Beggiatoa sp. PS]